MKINVPTSWGAVTLRQFQALTATFKESSDGVIGLEGDAKRLFEYHTECALISTLTDVHMDVIMEINRPSHVAIMNQLAFLQTPIEGELKKKVLVNGRVYKFETNARKINGGQWVTIMHFLQDESKIDANLHNLMACFAYRYSWFRSKYNGKLHDEIAKDMLDLPITTVKPLTDFFLQDWLKSVKSMAVYLEMVGKQMKRQAERELARSKVDTVGYT